MAPMWVSNCIVVTFFLLYLSVSGAEVSRKELERENGGEVNQPEWFFDGAKKPDLPAIGGIADRFKKGGVATEGNKAAGGDADNAAGGDVGKDGGGVAFGKGWGFGHGFHFGKGFGHGHGWGGKPHKPTSAANDLVEKDSSRDRAAATGMAKRVDVGGYGREGGPVGGANSFTYMDSVGGGGFGRDMAEGTGHIGEEVRGGFRGGGYGAREGVYGSGSSNSGGGGIRGYGYVYGLEKKNP